MGFHVRHGKQFTFLIPFTFRPKRFYGMGLSVCPSVRLYITPLLQQLENHMSKGNKGNRPERQLAALAKQALRTSVYTYIEYLEAQFT
jgi:iron-sulfur cluster repair protein YtfE (RIC family)